MTTQFEFDINGLKPATKHNNVNLYEFQPILTLIAPNSIFTNHAIIEFKARIHGQFRNVPDGGFQKPVGLSAPDGTHIVLYPEPMLQRLAELIRTELADDFMLV